eukprot:scaffold1658_cov393-Prasinococcus_capsulatus_cf.AAC.12
MLRCAVNRAHSPAPAAWQLVQIPLLQHPCNATTRKKCHRHVHLRRMSWLEVAHKELLRRACLSGTAAGARAAAIGCAGVRKSATELQDDGTVLN